MDSVRRKNVPTSSAVLPLIAALGGALALVAAWVRIDRLVLNVGKYTFGEPPIAAAVGAYLPVVAVVVAIAVLGIVRVARGASPAGPPIESDSRTRDRSSWAAIGCALVLVVIAASWWAGLPVGYVAACGLVVCAGGLVAASARSRAAPHFADAGGRLAPCPGDAGRQLAPCPADAGGQLAPHAADADRRLAPAPLAPLLLGVVIALATLWHAAMQYHFWRHLMLGYADFGLFTRELEYCLPWSRVAERFAGTRMGYHFEPLFYALTPLYALFRSPVFLMVAGPLAINLSAIAFYRLARHHSGSAWIGLLIGLCWLGLPSVARMPYAGSYGFESVHLAVPCVALALSCAFRERWTASHVWLAAAVLCQETVCGVALGWGVYLLLFGKQRRAGAIIAVAALLYLALATLVIIPQFAPEGTYNRMEHFGELSPQVLLERLSRPRVWYFLLALAAPLWLGLVRFPRLLLVAVPTLLAILVVQNEDYLSIKYWHQSSILPVIFAAAVLGVTANSGGSSPQRRLGLATGMLAATLLLHQLMGFSPFAQGYRVIAANRALQAPDARIGVIESVQEAHAPENTRIVATERVAAHFSDYYAIHTAAAAAGRLGELEADVLILDESDTWDTSVAAGRINELLSEADRLGYTREQHSAPLRVLIDPPR